MPVSYTVVDDLHNQNVTPSKLILHLTGVPLTTYRWCRCLQLADYCASPFVAEVRSAVASGKYKTCRTCPRSRQLFCVRCWGRPYLSGWQVTAADARRLSLHIGALLQLAVHCRSEQNRARGVAQRGLLELILVSARSTRSPIAFRRLWGCQFRVVVEVRRSFGPCGGTVV